MAYPAAPGDAPLTADEQPQACGAFGGRRGDGRCGVRRVPFNVIDEVIDLLDSDEEPWSVQVELRVGGQLDEERLREAVRAALERHPMARARKAPARRMSCRSYWEVAPTVAIDPLDVVTCRDDKQLVAARQTLQSTRIPLSQSPPLRLRLCRTPDGDVLMMNLHHAAADGFGGVRILQSIGRAYTGDGDPLPVVDFLAERDLPRAARPRGLVAVGRRLLALSERLRDLATPAARLAAVGDRGTPGYGLHHVRLSRDETRALVDAELPGSVNDVLVTALHLAVAGWNADHGKPCRRVTVLVPSNLRPPGLRREMAANFSLPARVTTTGRYRNHPLQALDAIVAQTSRKKRTGMGTALLELLSRSWLLPRGVRERLVGLRLLTERLTDTAVLSNLGDVTEPPDFGSQPGGGPELWFSAPARMPAGVSVGAVTVGGRLHLSFRYRRALFDRDAARRFADCYLRQLHRLLDHSTA